MNSIKTHNLNGTNAADISLNYLILKFKLTIRYLYSYKTDLKVSTKQSSKNSSNYNIAI